MDGAVAGGRACALRGVCICTAGSASTPSSDTLAVISVGPTTASFSWQSVVDDSEVGLPAIIQPVSVAHYYCPQL